jgi:hypothetical protein
MNDDFSVAFEDLPEVPPEGVPTRPPPDGVPTRQPLTLRKPGEILAMQFDDSDIILGDRLLALWQSLVIAGASGTGKSRLVFQLLACIIAGLKFLGFDTGGRGLSWLVLQTENSNRRFKKDLGSLRSWLGENWADFDKQVTLHTVETDLDCFVSLDSPENQAAILRAIETVQPGGVVIDPLNDFAAGDLNKDADMKQTLSILARLCRHGNPERPIIVNHHAITGKAGASKVTGFDRASFARNSKVLHAWARGVINLAAVDPDTNDRLIVACGKCSNGREFQPFGVRLNPESMIYEVDTTVDVNAWADDIAGNQGPLMTKDRVRELCKPLSTKAELAKAIQNDCGCVRQSAYRYISRAQTAGKIAFNKANETYSPK